MSQARVMQQATLSYIDNVFVDERLASADQVKKHLAKFGLACKTPKQFQDRAWVLRMHIQNDDAKLHWAWGWDILEYPTCYDMTDHLLGVQKTCWSFFHLWLAPHGDSVHETLYQQGYNWLGWWNEQGPSQEHASRVKKDNPMRGDGWVNECEFTVSVDASFLATGVMLKADGSVNEDVCWLCPANNEQHINLEELNAVLKGVSMVLQCQAKVLHLITDLACVHQWISSALKVKAWLTTKTASKILLQRQFDMLVDLINGYWLSVDAALIMSDDNKAD